MAATATRPRWRRIVKRVLIGLSVIVLVLGAITAWAVNRYIIDHVQISNVAAYEAAVQASTSTVAGASTTTAPTAPALVTDTSYTFGATSISIRKVVTGTGDATVTYFVADVVLGDATQLRSAFANDKFGTNIIDDTSTIAEENGEIFAINGDYYGFRTSGIVIRNGVIYRDKGARDGLAIYRDGTMVLYHETTTTAQELVDAGVWNTLSFGPGLLADGEILDGIDKVQIDTNIGNHSMQGNQPRTGLGMISNNHFVFIAVDGRSTGYSRGVTMIEFAQMFKDLGATVAYNLDGGGSTSMYFNGQVVNNPLGKGDERGTSDILYIPREFDRECNMIVLIPAYEPDEKLIRLIELLAATDRGIYVVLVNDGSGPEYEPIFDRAVMLGCIVIGHPLNRGKGFALKQGFGYAQRIFPGHDVVCADCDGQHSPTDILRVAKEVAARPHTMVLGSRQFTGRVPVASRFGNSVTRVVFARSTGRRLYDTQTGLRGYPASMLRWLQTVAGDRFEYELNVLLQAAEAGMPVYELPVETIYLEGNASSHFRPVIDSARVYAPLVKFSLSSLTAFVIDVVVLFIATALTGNLLLSVVTARLVSSSFNFVANRRLVFANSHKLSRGKCAGRYFALVAAIMSANYAAMHALYEWLGVGLLPSKLATETLLFFASYYIQKQFIFTRRVRPAVQGCRAAASESAARVRPGALVSAAGQESLDGESMHESSGLLRRG